MNAALTTALLAGGQSRRMGREKSLLPAPDGGPLWQWQWRTLTELRPAAGLLSRRADQDWPAPGLRTIPDEAADSGPLAGVAACLEAATTPLLLVLAVDLPRMTPAVLGRLVAAAGDSGECGAVFVRNGRFEPLAALYPVTLRETARRQLASGDFSLQPWIREAVAAGRLRTLEVDAAAAEALTNLNTPADYADFLAAAQIPS